MCKSLTQLVGACCSAALLGACASGFSSSAALPVAPLTTALRAPFAGVSLPPETGASLYVANDVTVTVYPSGGSSPLRTISQGIDYPDALAFVSNRLYVANRSNNTVTLYPRGGSSPLRTISQGIGDPRALAFDDLRNLYVANAGDNDVTVYPPGGSSPLLTINQHIDYPSALAFASKRLYVADFDSSAVTVYLRKGRLERTISKGIDYPKALAFGP